MNGFLTRLVQRGAGLPTAYSPSTGRGAIDATGDVGTPAASQHGAAIDAYESAAPPPEASGASLPEAPDAPVVVTRPVVSTSIAPRAAKDTLVGPPEPTSAHVAGSHVPRARVAPPSRSVDATSHEGPEAAVIPAIGVASISAVRVDRTDVGSRPGVGTDGVPRTIIREQFERRDDTASPHGDRHVSQTSPTRGQLRDVPPASSSLGAPLTAAANAAESPEPVDNRREPSAPARPPVTEAAAAVRLARPTPRDETGAEEEHVEVHIGRIEVKVAPPPAAPPAPAAHRSAGFDRYRRVRRYTDRNWY